MTTRPTIPERAPFPERDRAPLPNDATAAQRGARLILRFLQRYESAQSSAWGRESFTITPWGQTIALHNTPVVSRHRLLHKDGGNDPLPSIVLHNLMGTQASTMGLLWAFDLAVRVRSLDAYLDAARDASTPIIRTETWEFGASASGRHTALLRNGVPVSFPIVLADPMIAAMLDVVYAPTWHARYTQDVQARNRMGKAPWPVK